MSQHTIIITPAGELKFVWDDALADLADEGRATIIRAADVEPAADGRGWMVDCDRSGGGHFGPFRLRDDALAIERLAVTSMLAANCEEELLCRSE